MPRKHLKVHLLIVDPQNGFMGEDDGLPLTEVVTRNGVTKTRMAMLPVKGAVSDMGRLAEMIRRVGAKLADIHVTLDSHQLLHIANPGLWVGENDKSPAPFTIIRSDDMRNGMWRARNPAHRARMLDYLLRLEGDGKFPHCIWPPHCLIGTWGRAVEDELNAALREWEQKECAVVDFVAKGSAIFTEHFGGLKAQVEDPNDPTTQLNTGLLRILQEADIVAVAGEALSHCVKTTVEQVADNIGEEHIKKFALLTDCMSPVPQPPGGPDFPAIGKQFLDDMRSRGMMLTTSDAFLR